MARTLSFRSSLRGTITEFLEELRMECTHTEKALVEVVVALSHYQEEGVELFPQVLFCDDVALTLKLLQGAEPIEIGIGPKTPSTVSQALRKCAPLARDGWAVYVERRNQHFAYGVFRESVAPTSLSLRETVSGLSADDPRAIVALQVARKSVEVVGPSDFRLTIHLSSAKESQDSSFEALQSLVKTTTSQLDNNLREPTSSYLRATLGRALQDSHGALLAVVPSGAHAPIQLTEDAIMLKAPISIGEMVREYDMDPTAPSLATLTAYGSLMTGMIGSDGITLVSNAAVLLGYSSFVKSADSSTRLSELLGGARRRAFRVLQQLVDEGTLAAAFFRSSDGTTEFYGGRAE